MVFGSVLIKTSAASAVLFATLSVAPGGTPATSADGSGPSPEEVVAAYARWTPGAGDYYEDPAASKVYSTADVEPCPGGTLRVWNGPGGTVVRVAVVNCASVYEAWSYNLGFWSTSDRVRRDDPALADTIGQGANWVEGTPDGGGVLASWIEAETVIDLALVCGNLAAPECDQEYRRLAADLRAVEPSAPITSGPMDGAVDARSVETVLLTLPLTVWFMFILPWRVVTYFLEPRRSLGRGGLLVTDAGPIAARGRWSRRARAVLAWVAIISPLLAWAVFSTGDGWPMGPVYFVLAFGAILLRPRVKSPLLSGRKHEGRSGAGKRLSGFILGAVASTLSVLAMLSYVLFAFMTIVVSKWSESTVERQYSVYLAEHSLVGNIRAGALGLTYTLRDSPELFLLAVVLPMLALAYVLGRLGVRVRAASWAEIKVVDNRPPIVYLRSFDEDRVHLAARYLRSGLWQWMTPARRIKFEEAVARSLSLYGPVISVSPPGKRLSELGAAKFSLPNDRWQTEIEGLLRHAACVVMSATPREVNEGLAWEIGYVGVHPEIPLVLVRGPWRRSAAALRWSNFVWAANNVWPVAGRLDPNMPTGVQAMSRAAGQPWLLFGSRRWSDWTYGASVRLAVEDALHRRERLDQALVD